MSTSRRTLLSPKSLPVVDNNNGTLSPSRSKQSKKNSKNRQVSLPPAQKEDELDFASPIKRQSHNTPSHFIPVSVSAAAVSLTPSWKETRPPSASKHIQEKEKDLSPKKSRNRAGSLPVPPKMESKGPVMGNLMAAFESAAVEETPASKSFLPPLPSSPSNTPKNKDAQQAKKGNKPFSRQVIIFPQTKQPRQQDSNWNQKVPVTPYPDKGTASALHHPQPPATPNTGNGNNDKFNTPIAHPPPTTGGTIPGNTVACTPQQPVFSRPIEPTMQPPPTTSTRWRRVSLPAPASPPQVPPATYTRRRRVSIAVMSPLQKVQQLSPLPHEQVERRGSLSSLVAATPLPLRLLHQTPAGRAGSTTKGTVPTSQHLATPAPLVWGMSPTTTGLIGAPGVTDSPITDGEGISGIASTPTNTTTMWGSPCSGIESVMADTPHSSRLSSVATVSSAHTLIEPKQIQDQDFDTHNNLLQQNNHVNTIPHDVWLLVFSWLPTVAISLYEGTLVVHVRRDLLQMRAVCTIWHSNIEQIGMTNWFSVHLTDGIPWALPASTSVKRRRELQTKIEKRKQAALKMWHTMEQNHHENENENDDDAEAPNRNDENQSWATPANQQTEDQQQEEEIEEQQAETEEGEGGDDSSSSSSCSESTVSHVLLAFSELHFQTQLVASTALAGNSHQPEFARVMRNNNAVQQISKALTCLAPHYILTKANLKCSSIDWLFALLKRQPQLESLRVYGIYDFKVHRNWKGVTNLALQELSLTPITALPNMDQAARVEISDQAVSFLAETLKRATNLRELHLPHHLWGDKAAAVIAEHAPQLSGLVLHDWDGPPTRDNFDKVDPLTDKGVVQIVKSCTQLKRLAIQGLARLSENTTLADIFSHAQNLETLMLVLNSTTTSTAVWELPPLTKLRTLRIVVTWYDQYLCEQLIKACPSLETLAIKNWTWFPRVLHTLLPHAKALKELVLEDDSAPQGIAAPLQWVLEQSPYNKGISIWPKTRHTELLWNGMQVQPWYQPLVYAKEQTVTLMDDVALREKLAGAAWGDSSWLLPLSFGSLLPRLTPN
eukprot:TRINITY_DN64815_c0_g1_i2.p1 TRINITY_DN64815_c0_g1~~TRINITY_DN64815_c0_g1_i2.p1  ORF type:complete len:1091 (-),score=91.89 TRINITY_DN64815_c0_g1_i2:1713-4886(-)